MTNNYYQNHKEKLQKEECERYENLSEKRKNKEDEKRSEKISKSF